jgi:hypothetical protein
MKNKKNKNDPQEHTSSKEVGQTLENLGSEIESIRANLQKGKSDTTTLKILFYTGLAVLLFGFMYTNQTLQRAQHRNLESHISFLQGQVNNTLFLLEKKLHKEILDLEAELNGTSRASFNERIQNMNQALGQLEPESTSMGILIDKVKKTSNELNKIIEAEKLEKALP